MKLLSCKKTISGLILATMLLTPCLQIIAQGPETQHALLDDVDQAISRAQDYLLGVQNQDGYWNGRCYFHTDVEPDLMGLTSIYIHLLSNLGINKPGKRRAVDYLVSSQLPDGSWGTKVMSTYLAAWALERSGMSPSSQTLQKAYDYLQQRGESVEDADAYYQFFYALAGRYSWRDLDDPLIVGDLELDKAMETQPETKKINVSIMPLAIAIGTLGLLDTKGGTSREQRQTLRKAETLMLQEQWSSGSWFGSETHTVLTLMALYELGHEKNEEPIVRGLQFLEDLQFEDGSMPMFKLPIWETGLVLMALEASGLDMDREEIKRARDWLLDSRNPAGGWAYTAKKGIPDVDDTSFPILALLRHEPAVADEQVAFVFSLQNQDGGWATFTRDHCLQHQYVKWMPEWALFDVFSDPSAPDTTAHALHALGQAGYTVEDERVRKAVDFLQRVQFDNGAWFAMWGVPYLYGTGAVLVGLEAVGADMEAPYVQKSVEWLQSLQNADGGWGEPTKTRDGPEYAGLTSESTASQTAWVLSGLLAAGIPPESEVIERGISYLISRQREDGGWDIAVTLMASGSYPYAMENGEVAWPLLTLSTYRSAIRGTGDSAQTSHSATLILIGGLGLSLSLLGLFLAGRFVSARRSGSSSAVERTGGSG